MANGPPVRLLVDLLNRFDIRMVTVEKEGEVKLYPIDRCARISLIAQRAASDYSSYRSIVGTGYGAQVLVLVTCTKNGRTSELLTDESDV